VIYIQKQRCYQALNNSVTYLLIPFGKRMTSVRNHAQIHKPFGHILIPHLEENGDISQRPNDRARIKREDGLQNIYLFPKQLRSSLLKIKFSIHSSFFRKNQFNFAKNNVFSFYISKICKKNNLFHGCKKTALRKN